MSEQSPDRASDSPKPAKQRIMAGLVAAGLGFSTEACVTQPTQETTYAFFAECPASSSLHATAITQNNYLRDSIRLDLRCSNNINTVTEPTSVTEINPAKHITGSPLSRLITMVVTAPEKTNVRTSISEYDFNITITSSQPGADFQFKEGVVAGEPISSLNVTPYSDQP